MEFAHEFPALVDPSTGMPRSWRQFIYGLQELGRIRARESVLQASAAGVPFMKDLSRQEWMRERKKEAGW